MKPFPQSVTFQQMQDACRALGLPLEGLVSVAMDVTGGVDVYLHVSNNEGRIVAHCGRPLETSLHIPVRRGEVDDAAPR